MTPERFEIRLDDPRGAVLVLAGSSGRIEEDRVGLLAEAGFAASSVRWFGGAGQAPGICEIPLERFHEEIERLHRWSPAVSLLGTSKGAEAALLVAAEEPALHAVVALAPTDVVWANIGPGLDGAERPQRSSWTRDGQPLPWVPYEDAWEPTTDPPEFLELYRRSRRRDADRLERAQIPVERIDARVLLIAGGDDRVWDSVASAERIADRRRLVGRATEVVIGPAAGHRVVLPGEHPHAGGASMARGGTPAADAALGRQVWPRVLDVLA